MNDNQLSEIFKTEYSNLVAVLCHYYNVADIQIAEDIVSETFIKAMKSWSHNGVPKSPKAWLRKTAKHILIDQKRRKSIYEDRIIPNHNSQKQGTTINDITDDIIEDSQLRMIFVVCDPKLSSEAKICLALRILCGFTIDEIAKALLSNKSTINKKLYRAKQILRVERTTHQVLSKNQRIERIDAVLRVIYLIFNEGYYSSSNEENIRQEMCWDAMYLCKILEKQKELPQSKICALMALMCLHASRFEARNFDVLFDAQDRSKWDHRLIQKGEQYLSKSANGNIVSKYHIEAAIAYWHTVDVAEKWNNILQLYNKLLTIEYSPIIAMNRTYALAKANSVDEAIREALKLNLYTNHYYYCLIAELYRMKNDTAQEVNYLNKALAIVTKTKEKELIIKKLDRIG